MSEQKPTSGATWLTTPSFAEAMDRMFAETYDHLELLSAFTDEETAGQDAPAVRKVSSYVPVSCCQMTDATGVNHCEHPPPPRPHWRKRLRWRIRDRISRVRMRVGCWVAGVDLDEWEADR